MEFPPLLPAGKLWLAELEASPTRAACLAVAQKLLSAPSVTAIEAVTFLELFASASRKSRFLLPQYIRQLAHHIAGEEGEDADWGALAGNVSALMIRFPTPSETQHKYYYDDLFVRLWESWFSIPDPGVRTHDWERHLALLPMIFNHRIMKARLFVWPPTEVESHNDVLLELLLDCNGIAESLYFEATGNWPAVRFESLDYMFRGEGEYDRKHKTYAGPDDLLGEKEEWSPWLLDLPRNSEFGYLFDNSIADIQVLIGEERATGLRCRFAQGPDIWSMSAGDCNQITIGEAPEAELGGIWCSEYQP